MESSYIQFLAFFRCCCRRMPHSCECECKRVCVCVCVYFVNPTQTHTHTHIACFFASCMLLYRSTPNTNEQQMNGWRQLSRTLLGVTLSYPPALFHRASNKCTYTHSTYTHSTQHVFHISQLCRTAAAGDVLVSFPLYFNSIFHQFHFIWVLRFYNLTFFLCMPVSSFECLPVYSVRSFVFIRSLSFVCMCVCLCLFVIFVDSFPCRRVSCSFNKSHWDR